MPQQTDKDKAPTRIRTEKAMDRFFVAILLTISGIALAGTAFEIRYLGRVYPGVYLGEKKVSGLTFDQVRTELEQLATKRQEILMVWGVNEWQIKALDIGLNYDIEATVRRLGLWGRSGKPGTDILVKIRMLFENIRIEPTYQIDHSGLYQQLQAIADQIDIPAREPEITINNNEVVISAGENGRRVDKNLLTDLLLAYVKSPTEDKIAVPVLEIKPKLSEDQVQRVRNKAMRLVGKKIIFEENKETWEVGQEQLVSWLELRTGAWNKDKIREWVQELAVAVNKPPQNATFRYVGEGKVEEFKPAEDGKEILTEQTVNIILVLADKLAEGNETEFKTGPMMQSTPPEIDNDDVNNLGIRELIGRGESWYSGSITNRIFNLKKAAETISGTLVAPGEIFSFNQTVGEVSADTGYKQAYIIKEGKTILGDGGGVCQVSSTMFRAALAAGLPIEARTAHAYRVHYYEEKYQPGFDATVFQPSPDFKFLNDTGHHILIQAVYDEKAKYLAFELYGTADGRKVETSKARVWEVTAPPPDLYIDDPTLPIGKVVQTEHAAWGAKVAFDWKVTRGEEILQERTFYSNYKSWQAVYLRGTKPL